MWSIFPYFNDFFTAVVSPPFSKDQMTFLLIEHSIDTVLYGFLCVLVLINFWKIIVKQGKWRTLPLLLFYVLSLLAIYAKLPILIFYGQFKWRWLWISIQF